MNIRPSGAHQWLVCGGSISLQENYPDNESDATREGTACHEVAEKLLRAFTDDGEIISQVSLVGGLTTNDVLIDDQMFDAATLYMLDILGYCNIHGLLQGLHIEETISIDRIYSGMPGTPDCWVYNQKESELVIWDLKYGHGVVEVFENPQLLCYVAGIIDSLGIDGHADQSLTVRMRIVQPRAFHQDGSVREWSEMACYLRGMFNKLAYSAQTAMSEGAECNTGTHCRYCTGRHACSALSQTVYNCIDVVGSSTPVELSNNHLSTELLLLQRVSNLIKYRLDAIEQEATSKAKGGEILRGFMIEDTFGRKRWGKNTPVDQVTMMGDLMGVELRKPVALITPTQAKAKGLDEKIVKQYSETPKTGSKLVVDDGSKARQVFK